MDFNFNWNYIQSGAPYVTISTLGLAFNSTAIELLGNPEKVILGFDIDKLVIGIKAYDGKPDIKSYDFSSRIKNGWIRIGCKDFVKNLSNILGVEFVPAKKYMARYNKEEGLLYIVTNTKGEEE